MNTLLYDSPLGTILIKEEDNAIIGVDFACGQTANPTPLLREAARQLDEYFAGTRREFDLPLSPKGTDFQQKVWAALQAIPYGQTVTYKDIAIAVGNSQACRAVGMANHNNKIGIIIPCHRVIGTSGNLTGYAGGLDKKQKLLELESDKKS